jgi:hypothetical protein
LIYAQTIVEKLKAQGSKRKEKGPEHKDFDWWKGMVVILETSGSFFKVTTASWGLTGTRSV